MKKIILLTIFITNISLASEFSSLQWAINNDGQSVPVKLTDIKLANLIGKRGEDINLSAANETSKKVRVAVIDSGIDLNHPELKDKVYRNEGECEAMDSYNLCLRENEDKDYCDKKWAFVDTDKNGYPMDCHGWNMTATENPLTKIQGNNNVQDLIGHGTHVSGIIAAKKNEFGITGIIENVEILPVKVSGADEATAIKDAGTTIFARGIEYAMKQKVDVINLSVGWASNDDSIEVTNMIKKAVEQGIIVIVAGGNSSHSTVTYPCSYHEVICVGSHDPSGEISVFSNYGSSIDVLAPGNKILSTWPIEIRPKTFVRRHGYEFKNGTSFSAPHVTGIVAKLLNLGFTPSEVRVKILGSTRKSNSINSTTLNGNVDFTKALNFKAKSFIYPYKKTPAIVNWNGTNRKIKVRLKNYNQDAENVSITLTSRNDEVNATDPTKIVEKWTADEVKEFEFTLKGPKSVDSEITMDISISSLDESKHYPLQVLAVTIVHDKFKREDTERKKLKSKKSILNLDIFPIKNLVDSEEIDFLAINSNKSFIELSLIKNFPDGFKRSRPFKTSFKTSHIFHMVKLDLDNDGKNNYVIIGMYQDKDEKWRAKFYVFDDKFKPMKYEITKNNDFNNFETSLSSDIRWTKINNKIVPTWISTGYTPSVDLPPLSPWNIPEVNTFKRRIYYLTPQGLRTLKIDFDEWDEFSAIKFFPQTKEDLLNFRTTFLFTKGVDFLKDYFISTTDNIKNIQEIDLDSYQNLYEVRPNLSYKSNSLLFSRTPIETLKTELTLVKSSDATAKSYKFFYNKVFDPIQTVFETGSESSFFALTKYNILFLGEHQTLSTESRNTDYNHQYKAVRSFNGIYLSSKHTPGLSSELIVKQADRLIRPSQYRFIPYNDCSEVGFTSSPLSRTDKVHFYCDKSKTFFSINL